MNDLLLKIEDLITSALNRRYNAHAKNPLFATPVTFNRDGSFKNVSGKVRLHFPEAKEIKGWRYRLPQTRVFYTVFNDKNFYLSLIDFFNTTIVLFRGTDCTLKLLTRENHVIFDLNGSTLPQMPEVGVVWVAEKRLIEKHKSPLHFLHFVLKTEYEQHPLNFLKIPDSDLLKEIDDLTVQAMQRTATGHFSLDLLKRETGPWQLEFFTMIGLHNPVIDFYRKCKRAGKPLPASFNEQARGLGQLLQHLGNKRTEFLFKDNSNDRAGLLQHFFESKDLLKDIQSFWEKIQIPATALRYKKEVEQNPQRFMAFVLLAVQNGFWWAEQSFYRVFNWLPERFKPIFKLLFITMQRIAFAAGEQLILSSSSEPFTYTKLSFTAANVSFHRFGKRYFSEFELPNFQLKIKIDKWCDWIWDGQKKQCAIKPKIFHPPLKALKWQTARIKVQDTEIIFPLIWEQTVLEINGVRFKWLRKKRRFQISVKQCKPFKTIFLNEQKLQFEARYGKFYLPIDRREAQSNLELFALQGKSVKNEVPVLTPVTLRGAGLDVFGMLKEHFRYRLNNGRKNFELSSNTVKAQPVVLKAPGSVHIHARRFPVHKLTVNSSEAYLEKLQSTSPERLQVILTIWLNEHISQELQDQIVDLCFEKLGFVPIIRRYSKSFTPGASGFHLVISDQKPSTAKLLVNCGDFQLMERSRAPRVKFVWISTNRVEQGIKNLFYCSSEDCKTGK